MPRYIFPTSPNALHTLPKILLNTHLTLISFSQMGSQNSSVLRLDFLEKLFSPPNPTEFLFICILPRYIYDMLLNIIPSRQANLPTALGNR